MPRAKTPTPPAPADTTDEIQTVAFVSLGCPKNLVDSEKMLGLLAQEGVTPVQYDLAEAGEPVDAVVVNTCGFLEASKDESLGVIKDALARKEAGQIKRVIVAGCLVQRHRAKIFEWAPGIDAMVGVFDRDKIVQAVQGDRIERRAAAAGALSGGDSDAPTYWINANALTAAGERGLKTTGLTVNGKDGKGIGYFEDDSARLRLTPRHYGYLRISEGCNQKCAFCTIPSIRGKMRSKPLEKIIAEARELIADGCLEINLIGQDTTSYGDDLGIGFDPASGTGGMPTMLRQVSRAFDELGVKEGWVRLMYAYPSNFADGMIDALARTPRVLPYIDMPLQHGSDAMLTAMRRHITMDHTRRLLDTLRSKVPGIALRTTFISGFPGETDKDHQQLLRFVTEQQFENVGVFEYSMEPGTVAGSMEHDPALAVPAHVKAQRRGEIMALQQQIAFDRNKARAAQFDERRPAAGGLRLDVLIEQAHRAQGRATTGVGKGGRLYTGRTYMQAPGIDGVTFVQSAADRTPGELVPCTIVAADGYDLIARPTEELERRVSLNVMR